MGPSKIVLTEIACYRSFVFSRNCAFIDDHFLFDGKLIARDYRATKVITHELISRQNGFAEVAFQFSLFAVELNVGLHANCINLKISIALFTWAIEAL